MDEYTFHVVAGNGTKFSAETLTRAMVEVADVLSQGGHTASFQSSSPSVEWSSTTPGEVNPTDMAAVGAALNVGPPTPDNHTGVIILADAVVDSDGKSADGQAWDRGPEPAVAAVSTTAAEGTAGHEVALHMFSEQGNADPQHGTDCEGNLVCTGDQSTELTPEQAAEVQNGMGSPKQKEGQ